MQFEKNSQIIVGRYEDMNTLQMVQCWMTATKLSLADCDIYIPSKPQQQDHILTLLRRPHRSLPPS